MTDTYVQFASDGKQWEHSRALLRPQFIRDQVSDLSLDEHHVQALMRVLDLHTSQQDGWTDVVDLQSLFFKLTLDTATEFLFGESVDSQIEGLPGAQPSKRAGFDFAQVFDRVQHCLAFSSRFGPNYWIGHTREFRQLCKQVHEYVDYFVRMALNQPVEDITTAEKKLSSSDEKYVFLRALAKQTRDPSELRSQLLNILLAGRDTTASLLGWFFFILGQEQHAEVFEKLRGVILEAFGSHDQPKMITYAGLKSCHYLQWCINETLRLYPIVPLNVRTAEVDTTLPVGGGPDGKSPIYVKKGTEISYSVRCVHTEYFS
jgi:cytochrome P450